MEPVAPPEHPGGACPPRARRGGAVLRSLAMPLAVFALTVGCAHNVPAVSSDAERQAASRDAPRSTDFSRFTDIAIPDNATIDLGRLFVTGDDDAWLGRVTVNFSMRLTESYQYLAKEMPRFGWIELSSLRSAETTLTYTKGDRAIHIVLRESGPLGNAAVVDFTVTPNVWRDAAETPRAAAPRAAR